MPKILSKALKILLWLLLFAVLAGCVFVLVRLRGWPLWTGAAILLGPVGLVMGIIALRKHAFRRREKRYVKRIVEQEPDRLTLAREAASDQAATDLRTSFARALEVFRRSRLTRFANPVYALPWFVLAGESGSGKSSALRAARLTALQTDLNPRDAGKAGGLCQWWFQDNSVVLDLAGRFLDPEGDDAAWREFLTLLAKNRRREPISGFVLAVGADRLLGDAEKLVAAARTARGRLDGLMRVLGARFPVYLLVTRLDAVPGFEGFARRLEERERLQAMGALNPAPPETSDDRAGEIVATVAETLKDLRLVLANRPGLPEAGLARFPEAFGDLEDGLRLYCRELFRQTPYLETPLFRGLYFSSARHDDDGPARETPLPGMPFPASGASRLPGGTFLHDFFARILPRDRRLHAPLPAFLSWRNRTRFALLASVLAITLCLTGLFTFSYLRNSATMTLFFSNFRQAPVLTGDMGHDVKVLLLFRNLLAEIEALNAGWTLPRMGFNQSLIAEDKLEKLYCDLFQKGVLDRMDVYLVEEARSLDSKTDPARLQLFAAYLIDRIRMIESAQSGTVDPQSLELVFQDLRAMKFMGSALAPRFLENYMALRKSYLAWNTSDQRNAQERAAVAGLLRYVVNLDPVRLGWLVSWANHLPDLSPFTMEQFWDTAAIGQRGLPQVPPAFTLKGRARIFALADDIQDILKSPGMMQGFKDWYAGEYIGVWGRFAKGFPAAAEWSRNEDQWREITARMATSDNPYLLLLAVMAEQLAPYAAQPNAPSWVAPVMTMAALRQKAANPQKASIEQNLSSGITNVEQYLSTVSNFVKGRAAPPAQKGDAWRQPEQAGPQDPPRPPYATFFPGPLSPAEAQNGFAQLKNYVDALLSLRQAAQTPASSLALVASRFAPAQEAQGQTGSPFDAADKAVKDLAIAVGGLNAPVFDELLVGPLRFFWGLAVVDAAEGLQSLWQENVLVRVGHMPREKLAGTLFGQNDGLVWQFVNGPAKPFLGKSANGYFARESHGTTFPFTGEFLRFVNRGSTRTQKYIPNGEVQATAMPTDVNKEAKQRPYATELVLDCQEAVQRLDNYNYPVTQVFKWDAATCGKASLTLRFKSFTATKIYPGPMGFPNFLKEFQYDVKHFAPDDFPEAKGNLAIFDITDITVQYKLTGGVPLIDMRPTHQLSVPDVITKSWEMSASPE